MWRIFVIVVKNSIKIHKTLNIMYKGIDFLPNKINIMYKCGISQHSPFFSSLIMTFYKLHATTTGKKKLRYEKLYIFKELGLRKSIKVKCNLKCHFRLRI